MNFDVNYVGVVVATIVYMGLGFAWYGPLFGKKFMQLMNWDPNDKEKMEEMKKGMAKVYFINAILALLTAFSLAYLIQMIPTASSVEGALQVGLLAWLGFVITTSAGSVLFEGRKKGLYYLNGGYHLLSFLVMAAILALIPF